MNYVSMCKYNNYKFCDLTFFEGINKYSLGKLSANELAAVLLSQRESFVTVKIFKSKILMNFDVFDVPESE